jgi:hypothetical protein
MRALLVAFNIKFSKGGWAWTIEDAGIAGTYTMAVYFTCNWGLLADQVFGLMVACHLGHYRDYRLHASMAVETVLTLVIGFFNGE